MNSLSKAIGTVVAQKVIDAVTPSADQAVERAPSGESVMDAITRTADETLSPEKFASVTTEDIAKAAERVVTQDRPLTSWRLWSSVWGVLSTILVTLLMDPAIGAAIAAWARNNTGEFAVLIVPMMSAILPAISKAIDPRPVRGKVDSGSGPVE